MTIFGVHIKSTPAVRLVVLAVAVLAGLGGAPASAVTLGDNALGIGSNATLYSYLDAGESLTIRTATVVNAQGMPALDGFATTVTTPGNTTAATCTIPDQSWQDSIGKYCDINFVAADAGVYRIRSANSTTATLNYTITVKDAGGSEVKGRTWASSMQFVQGLDIQRWMSNGNTNGPATNDPNGYPLGPLRDINWYAVNDAGNIYDFSMLRYNGFSAQLTINAVGGTVATANTCTPSYISTNDSADPVAAGILPDDPPRVRAASNCTPFRMFFEPPSADLPVSALSADGTLQVLPVEPHDPSAALADLVPSLDPTNIVSNLRFAPTPQSTAKSGVVTFDLAPAFIGNYEVQVFRDSNTNGTIDDSDALVRSIAVGAPGGSANTDTNVDFDGKDNSGSDISPTAQLLFRVTFDKLGEMHLWLQDAEALGGITIKAVNGTNAGDDTVYWDDTRLTPLGAGPLQRPWTTTPIIDGRAGVNSAVSGGVHGWGTIATNPNNGNFDCCSTWGDTRMIDSWVFVPTDTADNTIVVAQPAPVLRGITPPLGPISGGTLVTITGVGFQGTDGGSSTTVTVGGTACGDVSVASDTSLTCTVPPGAKGTAAVIVTNATIGSAPTAYYTYTDNPITAVDPTAVVGCGGNPECFVFTVDTTGTAGSFSVPVSGFVGGFSAWNYNWTLDYGDNTGKFEASGTGSLTNNGINHNYQTEGQYQIAISPTGAASAGWMNAFGFSAGAGGSGSANAASNKAMFHSIDTTLTDQMRSSGEIYRFANMFSGAANAVGIPSNLFARVSTASTTDFTGMFENTFSDYAANSTTATLPPDLFASIDTSTGTTFTDMLNNTFKNYASRWVTFKVAGAAVGTQSFASPYNTKTTTP